MKQITCPYCECRYTEETGYMPDVDGVNGDGTINLIEYQCTDCDGFFFII